MPREPASGSRKGTCRDDVITISFIKQAMGQRELFNPFVRTISNSTLHQIKHSLPHKKRWRTPRWPMTGAYTAQQQGHISRTRMLSLITTKANSTGMKGCVNTALLIQ